VVVEELVFGRRAQRDRVGPSVASDEVHERLHALALATTHKRRDGLASRPGRRARPHRPANRYRITYVVLHRTQYIVTPDSVRRQYRLAYREQSRELPLPMIRGVELSRSRTQAALGYGTISFLAVGSNRGIGYVEFDNAADPEHLQSAVLELLENQREAVQGYPSAATAASGRRQPASANATGAGGRAPAADATSSAAPTPSANAGSHGDGETFEDDPLSDADDDARRPVSGNDDSRTPAEPDGRDD